MIQIKNLYFEPLKLKYNPTKVFVVSDLHCGHDKEFMYSKRGFESVWEHDETIIRRRNERVSYDSYIFNLGDIMFGINGEERLPKLLDRLNFSVLFMMSGNHAAGYRQLFDKATNENGVLSYRINSEKIVYFIPNYFEAFINGIPVVFSHYPLLSYNGQGKGAAIHCFGHVHKSLEISEIGKMYLKYKVIDTGIENFGGPISFQDIMKIMNKKEYVEPPDHHTKGTQNPFG